MPSQDIKMGRVTGELYMDYGMGKAYKIDLSAENLSIETSVDTLYHPSYGEDRLGRDNQAVIGTRCEMRLTNVRYTLTNKKTGKLITTESAEFPVRKIAV